MTDLASGVDASSSHDSDDYDTKLDTRIQLLCVWSGPVFVFIYSVFFVGFARFIPAPPPSWSAEQVASFYQENLTGIRIGQVGAMVTSTLLLPFYFVIAGHIKRIERNRMPLLTMLSYAGAALTVLFFALSSFLWLIASFRPDNDPTNLRAWHEAGWIFYVVAFPMYILVFFCVAITSFTDRNPDPIWPRWVGYLNLWCLVSGFGSTLVPFFKEGPFAWSGIIGFYQIVASFLIWIGVMTYYTHTWLKRNGAHQPWRGLESSGQVHPAPQVVDLARSRSFE